MNSFIDQGESDAMKTSGERKKERENGTFTTSHFCIQLSSVWLLANCIVVLLIIKAPKEKSYRRLNKVLAYLW